jgi:MFS family permease
MDIDKVPSLEDAIVALTTTTRYTGSSLMGIALAVYVGREASPVVVGMVLAVYALGMTVFAPLVGAIADITGRHRLVLVSTGTIATVIAAVLALAESTWSIVAIRGAYAAFEVGFIPVMLTIVSEKGGTQSRGRSVGFFNSAVALGYFFGQLVSGALISVLPPIGVYAIITGLSGVATVAVGLVSTPNIVDTADNRQSSSADVFVRYELGYRSLRFSAFPSLNPLDSTFYIPLSSCAA